MNTLEAARAYLKRGWSPVPIPRMKKGPIMPGWQNLHLKEDEIAKFFTDDCNIGLLTGKPSGNLNDIDLDCPEAVFVAPLLLPKTCISGRDKRPASHHWVITTDEVKPKRFLDPFESDNKKKTIVELRSTGQQTVVFPSCHPEGDFYRWDKGVISPIKISAEELQRLVLEIATAALLRRVWGKTPGAHHDLSLALGGFLGRRLPQERVLLIVRLAADGDPDLQDRLRAAQDSLNQLTANKPTQGGPTLDRILKGLGETLTDWWGPGSPDNSTAARDSEQHAPWEPPTPLDAWKLPPFPTDALPDTLRKFIVSEASATQTPPDLAGLLVLAGISVAVAKKVIVIVKDGWIEPVNIYVLIALPPGSRKSAVFKKIAAPIHEYEIEQAGRMQDQIAKAESQEKILKARLAGLERRVAEGKAQEVANARAEAAEAAIELKRHRIPAAPRFVADDVTTERLASMIAEQGGRMAILSPEGGIFENMAGRYNDGIGNIEVYLKAHAGDYLRVDRVGRPCDNVPFPALTMGLAVQPEVLGGLAGKPGFKGRGLLARFFYGLPPNLLGQRDTDAPAMAEVTRADYHTTIRALLALPFQQDAAGQQTAVPLRFSPEAYDAFHVFEREVEPQLAPMGELGHMADWAGKLVGAVARLAGLLHMAENAVGAASWGQAIDRGTVERAIRIGRYLTEHAKAAYAFMGADPAIANAARILDWVRGKGEATFTRRTAFNALRGRFPKAVDLDPPLALLVDYGHIRLCDSPTQQGPGRPPSAVYEVNPLSLAKKRGAA